MKRKIIKPKIGDKIKRPNGEHHYKVINVDGLGEMQVKNLDNGKVYWTKCIGRRHKWIKVSEEKSTNIDMFPIY